MTEYTPLIHYCNSSSEKNIFLKLENLQRFGSYKIRGVENIIKKMTSDQLDRGLSAASAGNMGQAVAFFAKKYGLPCTIVVPDSAPAIKVEAIEATGAVVLKQPFEKVWELVRSPQAQNLPGYFIHPSDNEFLREGYGKIVDEIIEQKPNIEHIVVPFGVGGLILGLSQRIKRRNLNIKIYSVEPETASPLFNFIKFDQLNSERINSFVDAIGTPDVIPSVRAVIGSHINGCAKVELQAIRFAMKELFFKHKVMAEGAGAAALAAATSSQIPTGNIACIISGGNIDFEAFKKIISDNCCQRFSAD